MKRLAFALLLLVTPAFGAALSNDALHALYAKGAYEEAARAGEAAHTAYGFAIAARAVLADAVLREAPCMTCLERGEALARQAVAADPKLADGQIWLAVALGYQARLTGLIRARLRDTPGQAKAALDAAVADDPRNAYAVSALGGWDVEVVKAGGPFVARHLYDADLGTAMTLFDRAIKLAPGNVAVRYQIGLSLAGLDPDMYRARIGAELDAAIHGEARTTYEHAMQDRAAALKALLGGNRAVFDARVRTFQGYP